jgi:hypothetical protein
MRYEFLTAFTMKIAPLGGGCNAMYFGICRPTCFPYHQGTLKMEASGSSETLVHNRLHVVTSQKRLLFRIRERYGAVLDEMNWKTPPVCLVTLIGECGGTQTDACVVSLSCLTA